MKRTIGHPAHSRAYVMTHLATHSTSLAHGRTGFIPLFALALGILILATAPPAAAFESTWGVTVDGSMGLTYAGHQEDNDPTYALTTALWSRSLFPLTSGGSMELAAQGSYTWTDDRPYLFDLDLLRLSSRHPGLAGDSSVVRTSLGRFPFRDTTGIVLSHLADGAQIRLNYPGVRVRVAGAYTGLLLNPSSDIRMTLADLADGGDDDELLGPARVIALGEIAFPEMIARQTVTAGLSGQYDLRDADDDEATLHTGYLSLGVAGPLVANLYHDLSGTMMLGRSELDDESEDLMGFMADARLRYFRSDLYSTRIGLRFTWASGAGDDLDRFVPISRSTAGTILTLPIENLMRGEFSYSMRPVAPVQVGYTIGWFFIADKEDLPDAVGVNPDPDGRWLGTEVTARVATRITSDLGLVITGGVFAPSSGENGVFTGAREAEYLLRVEVSTGL